ncbi:RNA polymerase sigma-70 factor [Niabella yanshanensis]|uniref:RNA polymerase sigma-70 factor n=1 Tax=Niabella yanshanensis TaxID=577386 RepID=A0ABZ0WAP0_9BACT|nr:RNA polymerase sigma-70 factor [Niabella yanshanensis]WQD39694.1 RNA polymerase sigma-70 factor [Niabella yanshanensis]
MIKVANYHSSLQDEELFHLFQNGENRAFDEIYKRYKDLLTSAAERILMSRQMAEDIVQEIFLSLFNRRLKIEIQVSLKAYLMKSMKFKILNEFRSSGVRKAYNKHVDMHRGFLLSYNTGHDCELKDLTSNIELTINMLPEKCRTAFLLSRSEDLSYKDISGCMGISISTVEKHISKALRLLKNNLAVSEFSIN